VKGAQLGEKKGKKKVGFYTCFGGATVEKKRKKKEK